MQITPTGFAFLNWGVVYGWQILWIAYAWSFLCRPNTQPTIFTGVYVSYTCVNCLNIIWLYLWGNSYILLACIVQNLLNLFLYFSIGLLFGFFHRVKEMSSLVDRCLTRLLPQNGLVYYATWTTLLSITNLSSAVPNDSLLNDEDCSTLGLTMVLAGVILYFFLENTLLDRFGFRYVLCVYPAVIWLLVTILLEQYDMQQQRRNSIYTAALLGFTSLIFLVRIILVSFFLCFRTKK